MLLANKSYPNFRYAIPLPGGATANIIITEDELGNPSMIQCNIGKIGNSVTPFCIGFQRLLTEFIRNTSLDEAIAFLSELSLDVAGYRSAGEGENLCRSEPEAFAIALRHYRKFKHSV